MCVCVYLDDECVVALGEHRRVVVDVRYINVDLGSAYMSRAPAIRCPDGQSVTRHLHINTHTVRQKQKKTIYI